MAGVAARYVDRLAPQAEWRIAHRVADVMAGRVARAIERSFAGVDLDTASLVARRDVDDIVAHIDLEPLAQALSSEIWPMLEGVRDRAAALIARSTYRSGRVVKAQIGWAFDETNPAALRWAERWSAQLVTNVTNETRAGIRALVGQAFEQEWPPRELARHLRSSIGLTERQVGQIARLRQDLHAAGVDASTLARRIEQRSAQLIRQRATNIARTETLRASNSGQLEAWRQGDEAGLLNANVVKEWIVTPDERLCPLCEPLDGAHAALDELFPGGVEAPPLHPSCRCAVGLAET